MKIVHITSSIDKSFGGPARSVPQTCLELAKLGVSIELIAQDSLDKVTIPDTNNFKLSLKSYWQLFKYGSKISSQDVNLIHLQHIWTPYIYLMAFWAYKKNIPYIITPRGMLEPWIMAHNPWKKKMGLFLYQHNALKRAVHIHATAQMEKDNIRKLGYNNPITIIPNGIDLSEISSIKNSYGSKKAIFLSRIHPKKGIELLLEAWRTIDTKGWTLEIAGNGDHDYVNNLVLSAKDLTNVHFVGAKYGDDKWDFLRSADVMVLPTFSENFGIVVAEALAVGLPVITTKGTPWEDLNVHNCGWWIDLSVENLKHTLTEIFSEKTSLLKVKGENGVTLIKQKYDMKQVGIAMENLYKKILKNK